MKTEKKALSYIFYLLFAAFLGMFLYLKFFTPYESSTIGELGVCFVAFLLLYKATYARVRSLDDHTKKYRTVHAFIVILFIVYLVFLINLLYFEKTYFRNIMTFNSFTDFKNYLKTHSNLEFFKSIKTYTVMFSEGSKTHAALNLIGNVAAFMPFGVFLPVLFINCRRYGPFSATMLFLLLTAELLQVLLKTGVFDVDDVLLNFFGALVIYWFTRTEIVQMIFKKRLIMI